MNIRLVSLGLAAAAFGSGTALAQPTLVDLDSALRCSAAFAIAAAQQAQGVPAAKADYPDLSKRGKEFFVQTGARLIDAEGLDRAGVQRRMLTEVEKLQRDVGAAPSPEARLKAVITPCLALLDLTVPQSR